MMKKHYSPGIPIILGRNTKNLNHAQITFGKNNKNNKNNFNLSKKGEALKWYASKQLAGIYILEKDKNNAS